MGFTLQYKRLFSVDILHGYYLNQPKGKFFEAHLEKKQAELLARFDIRKDLSVVPTPETKKILTNRKWVFRSTHTGFFIGAEVDGTAAAGGLFRPSIPLEEEIKLTFAMKAVNPFFFNYTNLRLSENRHKPYYFGNEAGNNKGTALYLSRPVEAFDPGKSYDPGDVYVDDSLAPTQLFEALRKVDPGAIDVADWQAVIPVAGPVPVAPFNQGDVLILSNVLYVAKGATANPPPDPANWEERPLSHQYVTAEDRIRMLPSVFSIDITASVTPKAVLKLSAPDSGELIFSQAVEGNPFLSVFPVDLRTVPPGRYRFQLENHAGTPISTACDGLFYLDQETYNQQVFGIIELTYKPSSPASPYDWIAGPDQEIQSPVYTIRFKNRSTYWRFIFNRDQVVADADLGELERDGTTEETRKFRTAQPKPLIQGFEDVRKFDTTELLPNPRVNLVKPDPIDTQIYSEIFV